MYNQGRPVSASQTQHHQMDHRIGHNQSNIPAPSQSYQPHTNFSNRTPNYSNQSSKPSGSKNHISIDTKLLSPKDYSKNPYVNGSQLWNKFMGPLCIRCVTIGHVSPKSESHSGSILENWEQAYLKEMVFSIDAQMCMLQLKDHQSQNSGNSSINPKLNTWSENNIPLVEEIRFEQFGSSNISSKSCVIGYDDQHIEPRRVNLAQVSTEYPLHHDEVQFKGETENNCSNLLKLAAYLNEGDNPRKHARVDIEDILNNDQPTLKSVKKSHRRGQKALQHLREIVGRSGKRPINYTKFAEEIRVNVSLLDLFQMSPELSRAFRNLSTRIVPKRAAKMAETKLGEANIVVINPNSQIDNSNDLNDTVSYVNMEDKAFCVPAVIRTRKGGRPVDVKLPSTVALVDTGSNMVVTSYGLVKYLELPMKLLSENGFSGLTMNVANGTSSPLKYLTSFQISVLGISRHIEAFVRPWNSSNEQEFHLLLGLPWLHVTVYLIVRVQLGDQK
ncbi:hypothetical protein K3495_g9188 [Podosphaera aphanis]|nr:hypothetical protein K3495_g9188 [Podosphaera aphanis]